MEKMLIVYRAYFNNSDKCYIGITNNLEKRKKNHLKDVRLGANRKFHKAIRKYGEPVFEIIETCQTIEELYEAEKKNIEKFNSFKSGYNSTLGGEGTLGVPRPKSQEWRKQCSTRMKGDGNPRYGIRLSESFKQNHSVRMKDYYKKNPKKKPWSNKSSSGMIWINDGNTEKKILKQETIPKGFVRGRIFKSRTKTK